MAFIEFKLAHDEKQEEMVGVRLDAIFAVVEIDQKKTGVVVNSTEIFVHGSYSEVLNKIRGAP